MTLGRYEVQEFLGQGPHGPTFRAYDPRVARSVVVEVLETLRDPGVRARLAQATPMLLQLRHPNLVDVYEVADWQGLPYLVGAQARTPASAGALLSVVVVAAPPAVETLTVSALVLAPVTMMLTPYVLSK